MGEDKLQELYDLAEAHDVGVYYYDLGEGKAVTVAQGDFAAIALNPEAIGSVQEETECLCHELGHLETGTLHPCGADEGTILRGEYKCACWVVRQLVPPEELLAAIRQGCTEVWELAERFSVSEGCMLDAIKVYRNKGLLR